MKPTKPITKKANDKTGRKKSQEIRRKKREENLDESLRETFPASDATAKY